MTITLVDTHCHLDFNAFDDDRNQVIKRALDAGVTRMVIPAIDFKSIESALRLAEEYPAVYAAVGIHPNDIPTDRDIDEAVQAIRQAASHPKVVAIGEIGLDYHWKTTLPDVQRKWLDRQLALAAELELPVILHNREATADALDALTSWVQSKLPTGLQNRPGVLHSFSGDWQDAQAALRLGFYLGFTGPLTYKNADKMRQVAANMPVDRTLLETDAPFLTPHPHRGQRNEPAYVRHTAEMLAEVRKGDLETVCNQTTHNAHRLFGWKMAQ
jgi:TatD DNase family protein